jgi:hypothetical protein
MSGEGTGMDLRRFKDLCQRLDQVAALLEIMEGEQINVDLYREASDALRDALAEIERLRSEVVDLQRTKFDGGLSNLPPASKAEATDWFKKFLERKRALTSEKVEGSKTSTTTPGVSGA